MHHLTFRPREGEVISDNASTWWTCAAAPAAAPAAARAGGVVVVDASDQLR